MDLAFRPNSTRRQRIALIRRWMVHAAGECSMHADCIVTSFWADPVGALEIWDESGDPDSELDLLRSGAVRIPRSLRAKWLAVLTCSAAAK